MKTTLGQRASDSVASVYGSWAFIFVQSFIILIWVLINTTNWLYRFDPAPFIGLNLILSLEAAYTGAFILMSQNRQAERDRELAKEDFGMNLHTDKLVTEMHDEIVRLQQEMLELLKTKG